MITWEAWPESLKVTLREARPVASGESGEPDVQVCSICLGNGRIRTQEGGHRLCLCALAGVR